GRTLHVVLELHWAENLLRAIAGKVNVHVRHILENRSPFFLGPCGLMDCLHSEFDIKAAVVAMHDMKLITALDDAGLCEIHGGEPPEGKKSRAEALRRCCREN